MSNHYESEKSLTALDHYRKAEHLLANGSFTRAQIHASLAIAAVGLDLQPVRRTTTEDVTR